MKTFLIVVHLMLPGQAQPAQVLDAEMTRASSAAQCQLRADTLAEQQRQKQADSLRRLSATVRATCREQEAMQVPIAPAPAPASAPASAASGAKP